jgi:hypothetical protein
MISFKVQNEHNTMKRLRNAEIGTSIQQDSRAKIFLLLLLLLAD